MRAAHCTDRLAAWIVALAAGCGEAAPPPALSLLPPKIEESARPAEPIRPLPAAAALAGDERQVALGRDLFFDRALSIDRTIRCVDCHPFEFGGADPRPRSIGVDGAEGSVQAPTIFNLAFNHCYNWDGRTCDLAAHALIPLENKKVMGMGPPRLIERLTGEGDYAARFAAAYRDGLTTANVSHALGAYLRTLVTPNAPFDRWLRGEDGALGEAELAGYRLFKAIGCVSCHQGTNVGGNLFQRFGVFGDPRAGRGGAEDPYEGRKRTTGKETDRRVFRVPSLRNVALTGPYFHDASAERLGDAVRMMARYQIGSELTDEQVAQLVAFLGALTGELPEVPRER